MPRVTPAMARTHQSAAQAILPYLFQYYDGRFERSTVIKVVSTTAAVPDDLPGHIARQSEFLMGAALWLLDYLEDACDDPDEYLDLLPVGPSEDLEYDMHCADDLLHDRTTILRIATLLDERRSKALFWITSVGRQKYTTGSSRSRRGFHPRWRSWADNGWGC